ncbi:hypothetical protein ABTX79_35280, partial [Streptomyces sp. NPDC096153]
PEIAEANVAAFRAGWNFGETTEDFAVSYEVAPADTAFPTGTYRHKNLGQLAGLIRARFLVDAHSYNQVNGMPFKAEQLATVLKEAIDD